MTTTMRRSRCGANAISGRGYTCSDWLDYNSSNKNKIRPTAACSIVWLLFLLAQASFFVRPVDSFASYLIADSSDSTPCLRDLWEGEIIMNQEVIGAAATGPTHNDVRILVVENHENEKKSPYLSRMTSGDTDERFRIALPPGGNDNEVEIHLSVDYAVSPALADLQYVMEVKTSSSTLEGEAEAEPEFAGATFVDGGCDGRRTCGRGKKDVMVLRIDVDVLRENKDKRHTDMWVQVWAGYATGYGAVTFTPTVTFVVDAALEGDKKEVSSSRKLDDSSPVESQSNAKEKVDIDLTEEEEVILKEMIKENEEWMNMGGSLDMDNPHEQVEALQQKVHELIEAQKKLALEKMHVMKKSILMKDDHHAVKRNQMGLSSSQTTKTKEEIEEEKLKQDIHKLIHTGAKHLHKKMHQAYHENVLNVKHPLRPKETSAADELSMRHFYYGCAFFIAVFAPILIYASSNNQRQLASRQKRNV